MTNPETTAAQPDFDGLLRANLERVFNERDAQRRLEAIGDIYDQAAVLYEPQSEAVGHTAISNAVQSLLQSLPPDFAFAASGPGVGHHGVGRLRWQAGPRNGPIVVTGTDVAKFEGGRIKSLYVFLDPVVIKSTP